jgi:hypothetical protein
MMTPHTRGEQAISWIESYCRYPSGYRKGGLIKLTPTEQHLIRQIYDGPNGPRADIPVKGALAAYLALLHTCGIEGKQRDFRPTTDVDAFTVWNAAGPDLRAVLIRKGERIVCHGLGTAFSPRAA